jgi:hypothetical protein
MTTLPLDKSAAMALGIAATAMPFADSAEDESERWLRILRVHGESSRVLSEAGVSEAPREDVSHSGRVDEITVARIIDRAHQCAVRRGGDAVGTSDVLVAVADVYGDAFDRVLHAHGTSREALLELLGEQGQVVPGS